MIARIRNRERACACGECKVAKIVGQSPDFQRFAFRFSPKQVGGGLYIYYLHAYQQQSSCTATAMHLHMLLDMLLYALVDAILMLWHMHLHGNNTFGYAFALHLLCYLL